MNDIYAFINGNQVPLKDACLPVSDLIIQRGFGVFDFFLVKERIPRYMSYHLDRFIQSAAWMGLDLSYTKEELSAIVENLIGKNGIRNSSVKIMLTGGISADDFTLSPGRSSLLVINKPFELKLPEAWTNGGSLMTCKYQREIPEAKTINYIRSVRLSQKLAETNISEVLYTDRNLVRECSRSNVFYVKDRCVFTPKTRMLQGVTRKRILQLKGFEMQETDFKISDLLAADEVFITSTTKGVLPIIKVDSKIISNGRIGEISMAIKNEIMAG